MQQRCIYNVLANTKVWEKPLYLALASASIFTTEIRRLRCDQLLSDKKKGYAYHLACCLCSA